MNTAVLTGRQVSQPMKVFIVSQGGEIADVTLHTSCHTSDDSALKVEGERGERFGEKVREKKHERETG
jgi:hypothetical protein